MFAKKLICPLSMKALMSGVLLSSLGSAVPTQALAKHVVIDTYPVKEGRVYINGEFAGVAPVEVDVRFGPFFLPSRTKVVCEGMDMDFSC